MNPITGFDDCARAENGDNVAAVQFVTQRNHAAIHLGADAGVADFRVHRIREIDGRRIAREHDHLAFRSKGVDLFWIEIHLESGKEFAWVLYVLLPFHYLAQPIQTLFVFGADRASIFVLPVSSDPLFRHLVHFFGADLNFKLVRVFGDYRGMQ